MYATRENKFTKRHKGDYRIFAILDFIGFICFNLLLFELFTVSGFALRNKEAVGFFLAFQNICDQL